MAAEAGPPATTENLTKVTISAWLSDLRDAGQSPGTVLVRYRGMRLFCRWLEAEGELPTNPMASMEQPKARSGSVPIIGDEQIVALFKVTTGTSFIERRDPAILRVLYDCGLRISECASLLAEDTDMDLDVLYVLGKGSPTAFGAVWR